MSGASRPDIDLAVLRSFLAVVDARSLSAAARRLGLAKSVVSERLTGLERRLGLTLFDRGPRLVLTDRGRAFAEDMRAVVARLDDIVGAVVHGADDPGGHIRITASSGFGVRHLGAMLADYLVQHPAVVAEVSYDDRHVDVAAENFDLALRIGHLRGGELVGRRLCAIRLLLCASPAYVERHGTPATVADLAAHRGLGFSRMQTGRQWQFAAPDGRAIRARAPRIVLASDSGEAIREALLAGLGLSVVPSFLVADAIAAGRLTVVDPGATMPSVALWALHPRRREPRPLVASLTSWLAARISDPPFWEAGLPV